MKKNTFKRGWVAIQIGTQLNAWIKHQTKVDGKAFVILPSKNPGNLFAAHSLPCNPSCLQMYDTNPFLTGAREGFVDTKKEVVLTFQYPVPPITKFSCCSVLCLICLLFQVHVSITRNSVIYAKFTIPRKQHIKVVLQKFTENGAELNPSAVLF